MRIHSLPFVMSIVLALSAGLATTTRAESEDAADPVTAEERAMFQEMYGQAGLDAQTLQTLDEGWRDSTHAERKACYDQFIAKVQEAVDAATPVDIRIVNPAEHGVAWTYNIDGQSQTLASGATHELSRRCTIHFDRGGNAGPAMYSLADGVYTFTHLGEGRWDLYRTELPTAGQAAPEPVTTEETAMFQEMYGQLDLDAPTRKTLDEAWSNSTHVERKTCHDQFIAKIQEAADAATPVDIRIVNPAEHGATWTYNIDGQTQTLASGATQELSRRCTIHFDRGGDAGAVMYSLADGTYTFTYLGEGRWDLYRTEVAAPAEVVAAGR